MTEHYRIKIKLNNIEIEVESQDKDYVDDKINTYIKDFVKKGVAKPEESKGPPVFTGKKPSLQELYKRISPKSGPQKALTVAYYYEIIDSKKVFRKDIYEAYKKIRFNPKNPSDTVGKAISPNSYLMDGEEKDTIIVTETGIKLIEEKLTKYEATG